MKHKAGGNCSRVIGILKSVDMLTFSVDDLALYVLDDINAMGRQARLLESVDDAVVGECVIAFNVTTALHGDHTEYHFAVLLSDGKWADVPGDGAIARYGELDGYSDVWDLGPGRVYDGGTRYIAIGGKLW